MENALVLISGLLVIAVGFNYLLTFAIIRRLDSGNSDAPGLRKGTTAPKFKAETVSGDTINLELNTGRKTVLLFISSTCSHCINSLTEYKQMYNAARKNGDIFLFVNGSPKSETVAFAHKHAIDVPMVIAPFEESSLLKDYNVVSSPFYCVIDSNGIIVASGHPNDNSREWQDLLKSWNYQKFTGLS